METKRELRRRLLAGRDALSGEERLARSARASEYLFVTPEVAAARTLLFFVSFGSEIDTRPSLRRALQEGKRVAVPRVEREVHRLVPHLLRDPDGDLAPGSYGILEPDPSRPVVPLEVLEAVIVPGVAWSEDGFRVGYGGGFYDQFLSQVPEARRVGFAFELQVVSEVPHNRRDLPVDVLVTEAGVRRFATR